MKTSFWIALNISLLVLLVSVCLVIGDVGQVTVDSIRPVFNCCYFAIILEIITSRGSRSVGPKAALKTSKELKNFQFVQKMPKSTSNGSNLIRFGSLNSRKISEFFLIFRILIRNTGIFEPTVEY